MVSFLDTVYKITKKVLALSPPLPPPPVANARQFTLTVPLAIYACHFFFFLSFFLLCHDGEMRLRKDIKFPLSLSNLVFKWVSLLQHFLKHL